jgi:hypothetical protein
MERATGAEKDETSVDSKQADASYMASSEDLIRSLSPIPFSMEGKGLCLASQKQQH